MLKPRIILRALHLGVFTTTLCLNKFSQRREVFPASPSFCNPKLPEHKASSTHPGGVAVDLFVKSNSVVGLGSGNSIYYAIERIGELLSSGSLTEVTCVAVNSLTERRCYEAGVPVKAMSSITPDQPIDIMIDSADEIDLQLNCLIGSKGSLSRERMMWHAALQRVVVIDDDVKLVKRLGLSAPLSVEVTPWGIEWTKATILTLPSISGARAVLRTGNETNHFADGQFPALTTAGNYVIDVFFDHPIDDPHQLLEELAAVPGLVSHGLFVGLITSVVYVHENQKKPRVVGHLPEDFGAGVGAPFWEDKPARRPLEAETVDNRKI